MFRLIIILFGLFVGFRVFLHLLVKLINYLSLTAKIYHHNNNNHKNNKINTIQDLAKCDYCGLYIISEESVSYNGRVFCCKEHAQCK